MGFRRGGGEGSWKGRIGRRFPRGLWQRARLRLLLRHGQRRILDIQPESIHQRTPLVVGSRVELADFERFVIQSQEELAAEAAAKAEAEAEAEEVG